VNDPRLDRAQNISAAQEEQAQRHRLNTGMMKDGTEPMEAPLPLQTVVTGDLPPAAEWEGSWIYNETTGKTLFSDGSSWVDHGALQTITLTGDVTGSGTASFATTIANDVVTFAKMQNISNSRLIGRNTASSGDPEEVTIEQALNWISGSANGDLMYRTSGNWTRLAIGSASQELRVNAGGTAPEWFTPTLPAVVALTPTGTGAVANGTTNVDIALDATYSMVEFDIFIASPVNDNQALAIRFSQGGSFVTGVSDYAWGAQGGIAQNTDEASNLISTGFGVGSASSEMASFTIRVPLPGTNGTVKQLTWWGGGRTGTPASYGANGYGQLNSSLTSPLDAIRFFWTTGNWNTGYILMRGYR